MELDLAPEAGDGGFFYQFDRFLDRVGFGPVNFLFGLKVALANCFFYFLGLL